MATMRRAIETHRRGMERRAKDIADLRAAIESGAIESWSEARQTAARYVTSPEYLKSLADTDAEILSMDPNSPAHCRACGQPMWLEDDEADRCDSCEARLDQLIRASPPSPVEGD